MRAGTFSPTKSRLSAFDKLRLTLSTVEGSRGGLPIPKMNSRPLLLRAALLAALFGFALAVAVLVPRAAPAMPHATTRVSSTFLPLVALPLVQSLLSP